MEKGIIVKGIAGFYYIENDEGKIVECKARGKFRKNNISPTVGDRVCYDITDDEHGVINEIMQRKSILIRPLVANVDQAIVVFSLKKPDINFTLLNKLLLLIEHNSINSIICINKSDLVTKEDMDHFRSIYENIGYRVISTNAVTGEGIEEVKELIRGKISVFAGPSGVGKSTLFNRLQDKIVMETGEISEKISRGKHTTRHAELIKINSNTYLVDAPGFSSIDLTFMNPQDLQYEFIEFKEWLGKCKFQSCMHNKEIGCAIKQKVDEAVIPMERYNAYIDILEELKNVRRRQYD